MSRASAPIFLAASREDNAVFSSNGAGADDQRYPAADNLPGEPHKLDALFGGLRVVFSGRAGDDYAVNTRGNQMLNSLAKRLPVD